MVFCIHVFSISFFWGHTFFSLCAFPSTNSPGLMSNSDSEKKCFIWEKQSNRSRLHSCLSQCFPVLQQLILFFSPRDEKFLRMYSKTKAIWGIWDYRHEVWCSKVYTLPLIMLLFLYQTIPIKIPDRTVMYLKCNF